MSNFKQQIKETESEREREREREREMVNNKVNKQ